MLIPVGAIVPLFLASFLMCAFQYYRISPDRRVLNLQFGMMLGAIVLSICTVAVRYPMTSEVLLALGLVWLLLALYLFRLLPPPPER